MKKQLLVFVMVVMSGCSVVGPGERGVRVSLGSVSDEPKEPGVYLWIPVLIGMAKVDIQLQKSEVESSAASKDMQEIKAHVAVNWSVSPKDVIKTYKNIGDEADILNRVIIPAVNEVMKSVAAKYTAEEVLTKRMEMKKGIDDGLMERMAKHGILLDDVSIVNLSFSSEFTKAIEQKQIAEQEALQAKYDAQKATQEANAEIERAKGQAESQKLVKASITAEILQQKAIEKWDGHFPQYMSGNGQLPFISIK